MFKKSSGKRFLKIFKKTNFGAIGSFLRPQGHFFALRFWLYPKNLPFYPNDYAKKIVENFTVDFFLLTYDLNCKLHSGKGKKTFCFYNFLIIIWLENRKKIIFTFWLNFSGNFQTDRKIKIKKWKDQVFYWLHSYKKIIICLFQLICLILGCCQIGKTCWLCKCRNCRVLVQSRRLHLLFLGTESSLTGRASLYRNDHRCQPPRLPTSSKNTQK